MAAVKSDGSLEQPVKVCSLSACQGDHDHVLIKSLLQPVNMCGLVHMHCMDAPVPFQPYGDALRWLHAEQSHVCCTPSAGFVAKTEHFSSRDVCIKGRRSAFSPVAPAHPWP